MPATDTVASSRTAATRPDRPLVLSLDDRRAADRDLVGGKAAALARASAAGFPVLPGFAVTVHATAAMDDDGFPAVRDAVVAAWEQALPDGAWAVARSSSVVEDADDESMAGQYETVADVAGPIDLAEALREVMASRHDAAAATPGLDPEHPIAVVVQQQVDPDWGGVAFGVDPVDGRPDRRTVAVGRGAPEGLVDGSEDGDTWVLDLAHDVVEGPDPVTVEVRDGLVADIATMVDELGELFGGPQDVEWAADADGSTWVLQSRPVTTEVTGEPHGPLLGTGPIAETFPDAVAALEQDLWVPPLRAAIAHALEVAAVADPGDVRDSPVVAVLQGRVAVDLDLFGRTDANRRPIRDRVRRIAASWRLGRLRGALPRTARRLAEQADAALADVGSLHDLDDRQLVDLLRRTGPVLRSLHGHEVLLGLVSDPGQGQAELTGTGVALRLLDRARREGLSDDEAVAREPAILALHPPRIGGAPDLPAHTEAPDRPGDPPPADDPAVLREALRMRVRWVHELGVRAAGVLGHRLADAALLDDPADVRHVALDDLERAVRSGDRPPLQPPPVDEPLPARFHRSLGGAVVPVVDDGGGAVGAGGGTATGPVHVLADDGDPDGIPDGCVLVVRTLGPRLATVLDRPVGLVAETGSPLSHVAILAREHGVATVVGARGALDAHEPGQQVTVDGVAGTVEVAS